MPVARHSSEKPNGPAVPDGVEEGDALTEGDTAPVVAVGAGEQAAKTPITSATTIDAGEACVTLC